ncbi:unnamed protein product [Trifolium pratense]|uniref:Uncharacterized protein n=1 Tax=Trifolium pratense TaxID=57577 RepID=A0ACB0KG59_TRIPR|nr:unnamed protein product [Trifolium pratense]
MLKSLNLGLKVVMSTIFEVLSVFSVPIFKDFHDDQEGFGFSPKITSGWWTILLQVGASLSYAAVAPTTASAVPYLKPLDWIPQTCFVGKVL